MSAVVAAHEPSARYLEAMQPALVRQFERLATAPGGVARLRELILTLAVQGKLVAQSPTDEPASSLLVRISQEAARLVTERKMKRERLVSPIAEDDVPFDLPQGWQWARLGAVLPFQIGKTPPSKDSRYWGDQGYYWVSISDMTQFGEVRDTARRITQAGAEVFGYEPLPPGTLLMSFKLTIGKVSILRVAAYHNEAIASFLPLGGMDTDFLKYALPAISQTGASKDALMGQTLNTASLTELVIGVPPVAEQRRIVARVDELMRLCDALEAKGRLEAEQHARLLGTVLGTLTESSTPEELAANWQRVAEHFDLLLDRPEAVDALEQTILQLAVRGFLVPQDPSDQPAEALMHAIDETRSQLIAVERLKTGKQVTAVDAEDELYQLPVGWAWTRIDRLASVQGGIQKTPLRRPVLNHAPYLRVANVQRDALDLKEIERFELSPEELERWRLRSGDLLIVEGNGSEHEIGRCAVWAGNIDPCVYQNHLIRVRCLHLGLVPFIQLFLNSPDGKAEMKRLAITTSGLFNLSVGKIRHYAVPVPPLAEQARIAARVTEIRRLCADLRQRLERSGTTQASLADALIEQALSA